jgi:hypothetical protein
MAKDPMNRDDDSMPEESVVGTAAGENEDDFEDVDEFEEEDDDQEQDEDEVVGE